MKTIMINDYTVELLDFILKQRYRDIPDGGEDLEACRATIITELASEEYLKFRDRK